MKYLMTQADSGIRGYGTLILAHGAGAPMDSDFMNQLADILAQFGVTVVRFEFPYMSQRRKDGKKRPPNRTPQLIECFEAVIADIDAMPTLPKPLMVGGKSMGGRMASMLAANERVKGVCCFGYPFHPPGKPEKLAARVTHLRTVEKPVKIFQGTRDPFGKPDHLSGILFSDSVQIEWLQDGDHDLKPRIALGLTQEQLLRRAAQAVAKLFATVC